MTTPAPKRHIDVGEQRIYHITHIRNLPGILDGGLLADVCEERMERPTVDISSAPNRETRRSVPVAGHDVSVAHYVPFFLAPDAKLWDGIRLESADPRLSPDAYVTTPYDFVVLVSSVKAANGHVDEDAEGPPALIVTDGDAAGAFTRFSTSDTERERALRRLRANEDSDAILEAEFLVAGSFPFGLVNVIGVANDKVRAAVKSLLAESASEHRPKVSIYPPWFQRPVPLEDAATPS